MQTIEKDGIVLARHIKTEDIQPGLNFFSNDEEFIQVGVWNYNSGKDLPAHVHNVVNREVRRTCEALFVVRGSMEATIYDIDRTLIGSFKVNQGEILVLLECGHGYRVLEDDTIVLEIKNGPYLGAEIDRERI